MNEEIYNGKKYKLIKYCKNQKMIEFPAIIKEMGSKPLDNSIYHQLAHGHNCCQYRRMK
jgi:regulatory protein YycI of two-component signal transduction system YycFG